MRRRWWALKRWFLRDRINHAHDQALQSARISALLAQLCETLDLALLEANRMFDKEDAPRLEERAH